MTYQLPSSEPALLRAGDTWEWTRQFGDFPVSEGWTLSYAIQGVQAITWDAAWVTNDGSTFTVSIPKSATGVTSGRYAWAAFVTGTDGKRYTAEEGAFWVEPDLATVTTGSQQAHAEKMVAAIQTELENRINPTSVSAGRGTVEKYTVHGRSIEILPTPELRALLGYYRSELARMAQPTRFSQRVEVRFVPVGVPGVL